MATDEPPGFGESLRCYRLAAGSTQETLAERAGLSVRGSAELECGDRRFPYPAHLQRLADSLQLNATEVIALMEARRRVSASGER
jgi:transcriptional regulator with XRE-family HTH domain